MTEAAKPASPTQQITGAWVLCGSAKFEKAYHDWARWLAFAGNPAFSLACFPSQMEGKNWYTDAQKAMLDHVHLRKIDMAQVVLVLNVGGYVGASTIQEILYAITKGKPVFSIEPFKSKALKPADRVVEFTSYMDDAPTEIYHVVGLDLERLITKTSVPKAEPEVARDKEPTERTVPPTPDSKVGNDE